MPSKTTRIALKSAAITLVVTGLTATATGFAVLEGGWYDITATRQHWQAVHSLLEQGMRKSVRFHARKVVEPAVGGTPAMLRGAALYQKNCEQCHGGPGVAQQPFAQSMQPVPGPLADAARRWRPRELYWITRHGIKMSGMPAWSVRMTENELWDVVSFLWRMPGLTAAQYRAAMPKTPLAAAPPAPALAALPAPNTERGRTVLTQYACQACHLIPGVTGPETYVGPPLHGLGQRRYIAGLLPTSADNLARWIVAPGQVDPHTTMPTLGVNERDARDMAAYLLTLRRTPGD
ncbi:c-type cytochrome [Pseudoduganella buxea]|uniref:C-type cytochrome n=1 Tax=Pseudoduganella buxea TaxID=1949069 RepID=A0A6I3T3M1_9BURK|nr:c-type cytochrome [Pseudoduganella buxea]MTV56240.1 c-type cytochrome [Pseudoduganella buxea]GGB99587.1 hypothetical protein GCM10011572_21900 [Pseudoduganella buxea]